MKTKEDGIKIMTWTSVGLALFVLGFALVMHAWKEAPLGPGIGCSVCCLALAGMFYLIPVANAIAESWLFESLREARKRAAKK